MEFRNFLIKLFFGKEWLSIRKIYKSLKEERDNTLAEAKTLKEVVDILNSKMVDITSMVHQINHNQKIQDFWDRVNRHSANEQYFEDWAKQMKTVDEIIDGAK